MLPRTWSTRAFKAVRARMAAASWSFCARSCCKFLISVNGTACALSWGCFGTGVDWSTNDRGAFSLCRCCFKLSMYSGSGTDTNIQHERLWTRPNMCPWNSNFKRNCRTLKATVLGPCEVLPVSIGIILRTPYIPFHLLRLLTQIKHCMFPWI